MTKEQLAEKLNGREYLNEITGEECDSAKESNLVVIFGYSDDGVELRGAITDEIGMWDGGTIYLHRKNVLENEDSLDCDRCLKRLREDQKKCVAIACRWNAEGYSWFIEPDTAGSIPFAPFEIVEDNEKFCRGIVIETESLPELPC